MSELINETENFEEILDFSIDNETRLELYLKYFRNEEEKGNKNNSLELLNRIISMYQFSGSRNIEKFMKMLIENNELSRIFQLEVAKGLLLFNEEEEKIEPTDSVEEIEIKRENNERVKERNILRQNLGYESLDYVCERLKGSDVSTPCQLEAIIMLMKCQKYRDNSDKYFRILINDQNIDCDYRYNCILSLEKSGVYDSQFFIHNACLDFVREDKNRTIYRILAGQYLLQHFEKVEKVEKENSTENSKLVQDILIGFATDNDLDYNLRADAADTLLSLGNGEYKNQARDIIMCLGRIGGNNRTIYDNAQNVHASSIEKSVNDVLQQLCTIVPILEINRVQIDYDYVYHEIEDILKEKHFTCDKVCKNNNSEEIKFCGNECQKQFEKEDKIRIALNRIKMDRVLYTNFNNTLSNIFVRLWSYIVESEYKDEMVQRLLEELEEMSGTCSSGFASRLVNVISGFDEELTIRISIEDQIVANFSGRLNARAQRILDKDSPFYTEKLNDILELYINSHEKLKNNIIKRIRKGEYLTELPPMKDIIVEYLKLDRETKIQNCIEDFSENVLCEMMVNSNKYESRQNFSLFFRTYLSEIREELSKEFEGMITETEFDLCIRRAISSYEGVKDMA